MFLFSDKRSKDAERANRRKDASLSEKENRNMTFSRAAHIDKAPREQPMLLQ